MTTLFANEKRKLPAGFVLHIPLAEAMLCLDCETISRGNQCAACGSASIVNLKTIVDGKPLPLSDAWKQAREKELERAG
jgi:hypothetical protein